MPIAKRGTLLIVSGPPHDRYRKHLHVVCSDPDERGTLLIVGISSVTAAPHDATCILQAHEHAFLRHDSYVIYARARVVTEASLQDGLAKHLIVPHADMNAQSFLRVKRGICRSPLASRKVKKYAGCAEQGSHVACIAQF